MAKSKKKKSVNKKKNKTSKKDNDVDLDKVKVNYEVKSDSTTDNVMIDSLTNNLPADLPAEARQKLEKIKKVLDDFQKKIVAKFQGYIMGISLLPPNQPQEGKEITEEEKNAINVLVLLDDADSKKMSQDEFLEDIEGLDLDDSDEE